MPQTNYHARDIGNEAWIIAREVSNCEHTSINSPWLPLKVSNRSIRDRSIRDAELTASIPRGGASRCFKHSRIGNEARSRDEVRRVIYYIYDRYIGRKTIRVSTNDRPGTSLRTRAKFIFLFLYSASTAKVERKSTFHRLFRKIWTYL